MRVTGLPAAKIRSILPGGLPFQLKMRFVQRKAELTNCPLDARLAPAGKLRFTKASADSGEMRKLLTAGDGARYDSDRS